MAERVLLVASTGGHLEELHRLSSSLVRSEESPVWVTFDTAQSRSLLGTEAYVVYVRRIASRGYVDLLRVLWPALSLLRRTRPRAVYSTGAGIALAFLPLARLVGARAVYIESAARTTAPSWTGQILRRMPWIELRTQHRSWADTRWRYTTSVFDCFEALPADSERRHVRKVVVTLGTQTAFPFVRMVQRIRAIVPAGVEVRWQLGTDFPHAHRPPGAREILTPAELREWVEDADAIVAHAGVGSALTLLRYGRTPVLVPRTVGRGEHVDDHQREIADELQRRGLAVAADVDSLTWDHVIQSTATVVKQTMIADD